MRKIFGFVILTSLLVACNDTINTKPNDLISEDKMIDIYYEVALYDAVKTVNSRSILTRNISAKDYLYKRFDVDSTQLINSHKYYAQNLDTYSKMFAKVEERLQANFTVADSLRKIERMKKASDTAKVTMDLKTEDTAKLTTKKMRALPTKFKTPKAE